MVADALFFFVLNFVFKLAVSDMHKHLVTNVGNVPNTAYMSNNLLLYYPLHVLFLSQEKLRTPGKQHRLYFHECKCFFAYLYIIFIMPSMIRER